VVDDDRGVGQPSAHGSGVGLVGVDHDVFDAVAPHLGLDSSQADTAVLERPSSTSMVSPVSRFTTWVTNIVGDVGVAARNDVSSRPTARGAPSAVTWPARGAGVVSHGVHGRPPRHTELTGQGGNGLAAGADTTGDVGARPFGQHGTFVDLVARVGERRHRTVGVGAAPQLLAPDQPDRHPRDRQVAHDMAAPVMTPRLRATRRATDRAQRSRLDPQRPLPAKQPAAGDDELVQSDQGRHVTTSPEHQGRPWVMIDVAIAITTGAPDSYHGPATPTVIAESRESAPHRFIPPPPIEGGGMSLS